MKGHHKDAERKKKCTVCSIRGQEVWYCFQIQVLNLLCRYVIFRLKITYIFINFHIPLMVLWDSYLLRAWTRNENIFICRSMPWTVWLWINWCILWVKLSRTLSWVSSEKWRKAKITLLWCFGILGKKLCEKHKVSLSFGNCDSKAYWSRHPSAPNDKIIQINFTCLAAFEVSKAKESERIKDKPSS